MAEEVTEGEDTSEEISEETKAEETLLTEADSEESESKEDSSADSSDKADSKEEASVVPETYEFSMPEGVKLDEAIAADFSLIAKDASLTQVQADKFVSMYQKAQADGLEAQQTAWQDQISEWRDEASSDSEIGGAKFQENIGLAKKGLDVFGNEKLKEALNTSGMGNHPEIIRMLTKIGAAVSDDSFVFGKNNPQVKKSHADIMFPNQGKN
tara:strand:+ start:286 stop:921 length:636 start_codon:yes stop_codon:yes gene_type:complete